MRLSERILGLVTTPERAASIVGDAMEMPGSPGVGRMVVSIVWHDMVASRGRVAWLGLGAFLLEMILYVLLVMSTRYAIGIPRRNGIHGAWMMFYTPLGLVSLDFAIGLLLARMTPAREFAASVAKTIPMLVLLAMVVAQGRYPDRPGIWLLSMVLISIAVTVPCFMGVWLVRRCAGRMARIA